MHSSAVISATAEGVKATHPVMGDLGSYGLAEW